jgi:CheY-like chemotaxis protein
VADVRALISGGDPASLDVLIHTLQGSGVEVVVADDGHRAWQRLEDDGGIALVVVDRHTPGVDGLELIRRIRRAERHADVYAIVVTARDNRVDLAACLDAGADDYLSKPLDPLELRARVNTALRVVTLLERLVTKVLNRAAAPCASHPSIELLYVCSYCRSVRTDDGWGEFERYLAYRKDVQVSHGVCPTCYEAQVAHLNQRQKQLNRSVALEVESGHD